LQAAGGARVGGGRPISPMTFAVDAGPY